MSESPASMMAMVEHLNSFPQAVPNSICSSNWSANVDPPKPVSRLLRWAIDPTSQKTSRRVMRMGRDDLTLFPEKWWTAVFPSML